MDYNYQITGQVIGRIRTQRKISQEVLSGLSGVARSHLAMIETGSKNANVGTLWKIAAALDMRLSDLIKMIEDEHERSFCKHKSKTKARIAPTEPDLHPRNDFCAQMHPLQNESPNTKW